MTLRPTTNRAPSSAIPAVSVLGVVLLAGLLGACARKTVETTGSIGAPVDYRERHPIVLRDAPTSLDVFVGRASGGLDDRQAGDVADFGQRYRTQGRGALIIQVPTGAGRDVATHRTLGAVRALLSRQGVTGAVIATSNYQAFDPELAAPIRLTFASLQAKVPHACGQWPGDLGPSVHSNWHSNEPYYNLGCATQAMTAAQIADPVDLVRSRPEGLLDTTKRMKAIGKFRDGKDPSTEYRLEPSAISKTVGSP